MAGIWDSRITRLYKCTNSECECEISYTQKASEKFKKKCPFCHDRSLVIKESECNIGCFVDNKSPKTLGMLANKNAEEKAKRGELTEGFKGKPPCWRKSHKINYDILKNPKKYISTGKI